MRRKILLFVYKILYLLADYANESVFRQLIDLDSSITEPCCWILNPFDDERKCFVGCDNQHVFKNMRNAAENANRNLLCKSGTIKWEHVETCLKGDNDRVAEGLAPLCYKLKSSNV